jgi:hypothetical protein
MRKRVAEVVASRDKTGKAALIKNHGLPGSYTSGCRCKECTEANRLKQAAYYKTKSGKAAYKKNDRRTLVKRRQWLIEQKCGWCLDCGYIGIDHPEVMDFDHVRGNKVNNVTKLFAKNRPLRELAQEILKCDLVCSNCHRIRSADRRRKQFGDPLYAP